VVLTLEQDDYYCDSLFADSRRGGTNKRPLCKFKREGGTNVADNGIESAQSPILFTECDSSFDACPTLVRSVSRRPWDLLLLQFALIIV
jgi:hypothetical protein